MRIKAEKEEICQNVVSVRGIELIEPDFCNGCCEHVADIPPTEDEGGQGGEEH
jgi:hypothetical protein